MKMSLERPWKYPQPYTSGTYNTAPAVRSDTYSALSSISESTSDLNDMTAELLGRAMSQL
jgi:hypothetical protein